MIRDEFQRGRGELRAARAEQNGLLLATVIFSVFVNLLMLTGPLYMLQVYDRVLGSRSEPTLIALSGLVTFLFIIMGLLDHARSRVLARVGARIQQRLERRVFEASLRRLMVAPEDPVALAGQNDVEALQRFWSSPALVALIDMPWTPVFLALIFAFNWVLGVMALVGGIIIVAVAVLNQTRTKAPLAKASAAGLRADRAGELMKGEAETIRALGMTGAAFDRWQKARGLAVAEGMVAADRGGAYSITSRTFRMFLQSAILGLGAWLVLHDQMTAGAMIAASILMGRALQPIEQAVSQWSVVTRAQVAHGRLAQLLTRVPPEMPRTALPRPKAQVEFNAVTVIPPGEQMATLRMMSFTLPPGQAMGVIGPSGAGKSTLARAMTGVWRIASGKIRLDGAALEQYDPDVLGSHVGYLPQQVSLFDGTVAENIARLGTPDPAKVVEAARAAAAHEMILKLPEGYDTRLSSVGGRLSGGQMQRIGLARALYGNPVVLILDEPNSNLDNEGSLAVNAAIRAHKAAGGSVIVMAHRPAAIQECDLLLMVEDGTRRAFGPRDQILREMAKKSDEVKRTAIPGGAA